jgi:hypothetical protein
MPKAPPEQPDPAAIPADAPADTWEQELEQELLGIESSAVEPPAGLQPRRVILTSQNGSSLNFVRPRARQSLPKS